MQTIDSPPAYPPLPIDLFSAAATARKHASQPLAVYFFRYLDGMRARGGMFAPGSSPTGAELACRNETVQIAREMGSPSLVQSTLDAFNWIGFDVTDLVPSSLVN